VLTVWRHYAARFLRAFTAALAILALLLIAVDAMLHLASLFDDASSPAEALRRLAERSFGAYAEFLIPAAAFVGGFWCAGSATLHHETLALKASAISPLVAFAPLLVLAGVLAALHFGAMEAVGVNAAARLAAARNPSGGDVRVRAGDVWYHAGRVVYSARGVDPRSGVLSTVNVYERDAAGRLVRTIQAARAVRLAPQHWAFYEALVREFDPERIADAPRERRERRALLALPSDRSPRLRRDELAGLSRDALRDYIGAHRATGADASDARIVLHNRLSGPFAVIAFVALAIPLALRSEERRSLARAALQGAGLFVAYLLARDMGSSFAARSPALSSAFPWLTIAALTAFALALLSRTRT
jgi:lipopolysaccharide export LptBFGC system permease protein LptF